MSSSVGATKIIILVDNKANEGLLAEHGLSVWVEAAGRRLLFDTGQGPALSRNAGTLDVALHAADTLVLSHGHYDHTGSDRHPCRHRTAKGEESSGSHLTSGKPRRADTQTEAADKRAAFVSSGEGSSPSSTPSCQPSAS